MKQPPIHLRKCPECHASGSAEAAKCWLCGGGRSEQDEAVDAELVAGPSSVVNWTWLAVLSVATMILFGLVARVAASSYELPLFGMFIAALALGGLVIALVILFVRWKHEKPLSWARALLILYSSIGGVIFIGLTGLGVLGVILFAFLYFVVGDDFR